MDRDKAGLRISIENILSPAGLMEYPQTVLISFTNCPCIPESYSNHTGSSGQHVSKAKMHLKGMG